jgi:hypothetical protein
LQAECDHNDQSDEPALHKIKDTPRDAQEQIARIRWSLPPKRPVRLSPLIGVLQNDVAPEIIDNPPFFDLFQGSKAAEAGKVVVQAAIPYARGLSGAVDNTH